MKHIETAVVDEVRDYLISTPCYNKRFTISREKPKNADLASLFSTASKNDNGNIGRCDIILEEKNPIDPSRNIYFHAKCLS